MIKLERHLTPTLLNPNKVKELTDLFLSTGESVWNNAELKDALLILSNNKCAYCECDLKEESKYMEVEHFENKKHSPNKVIIWDNLLPACKRCNVSKGAHDVITEPIINPFIANPQDHLQLQLYRFRGKTSLGSQTIDVVDLNHNERAVLKRFEIGDALLNSINELLEKLNLYKENPITRRKNRLLGHLEGILLECQEYATYTATTATILHSSPEYYEVVEELKKLGFWTSYFEYLHDNSKSFILT